MIDISLPTPKQVKEHYPLSQEDLQSVSSARTQVKNILHGKDSRLLLVIGPCSIHSIDGALEYASRLKKLSEKHQETLQIVMRAHVEKPRTRLGWKGLISDPHLNKTSDIHTGLHRARLLFTELVKMRLPIAMELLEPLTLPYLDDLITWGSIGARTVSSQIHRELSSSCSFPVGQKNSIEGSIDAAINAMHATLSPHSFFSIDQMGHICARTSAGNPDTHLVLRGSDHGPNCTPEIIKATSQSLAQQELPHRILIDCGHGNSGRDHTTSLTLCKQLIPHLSENILGFMVESYLKEGRQSMHTPTIAPDISVTDPCLSWEQTSALIETIVTSRTTATQKQKIYS
ncbi:MAG: 3-deoxy-7-phosphoheptulonate synthase [Simkaniaceae bacterium]|nr:3-deoxy-7-phosphoheptulonate synthase [Simkaniaceae bacterium]